MADEETPYQATDYKSVPYHMTKVRAVGVEKYKETSSRFSRDVKWSADEAIRRVEKEQEDRRILRGEERQEEALDLARAANTIATDTRRELRITWVVAAIVAVVGIVVAAAVAWMKKSP